MGLTGLDFAICGVAAALAVIGLFRGFSGTVGILAGAMVCAVLGPFSWPVALNLSAMCIPSGIASMVLAGVFDFVFVLIAFGITRRIAAKFVSKMVPQPLNALLGAMCGLMLASLVVVLLAATGLLTGFCAKDGFFAERSKVVAQAAEWIDAFGDGGIKQGTGNP